MRDKEELSAVGSVGVSLFIIAAGVVYLLPNIFPEGTLYLVAGILIFLVGLINIFKGIGFSVLGMLLAVVLSVTGLNKILHLEIGFFPILMIFLGLSTLIVAIKRFKD